MKHIINGAGMFCRTKGIAVPAGEWVQCHHYEFSPLFEYAIETNDRILEPERWYLNTSDNTLIQQKGRVCLSDYPQYYTEIQPADLQYVRDCIKREDIGEFEYRFPLRGELYITGCDKEGSLIMACCDHGVADGDCFAFVRKSKPAPKFIEYPVTQNKAMLQGYRVNVSHLGTKAEIPLHKAASVIGFAGYKFKLSDGTETEWLEDCPHIQQDGTPATPVKMRVWMEAGK